MDINDLSHKFEKVSEKYAKPHSISRDDNWYILKLQEELGELIQAFLMMQGQARTKGKSTEEMREDFEKEVADVFGNVLLLARNFDVDLEKVIKEKWLVYLED